MPTCTTLTLVMGVMMNLDLFNSLSEKDQAILNGVGVEWEAYWWPRYIADQKARFERVREVMTVIELTPEQFAANVKIVRDVTWTEVFEPKLGKEFVDMLRAQAPQV